MNDMSTHPPPFPPLPPPANVYGRRYGVCAGSERSQLGMTSADRKGGVPTLVVFRASDGALLTMDGVSDINQAGAGAVDRWEAAAASAAAAATPAK